MGMEFPETAVEADDCYRCSNSGGSFCEPTSAIPRDLRYRLEYVAWRLLIGFMRP
jgi:hypothetical protein